MDGIPHAACRSPGSVVLRGAGTDCEPLARKRESNAAQLYVSPETVEVMDGCATCPLRNRTVF